MKKSLLIVAHGSRRTKSNDEIFKLAALINNMQNDFFQVKASFLELAEPLIPDGIRQLIKNGSKKIVIYPYFLSSGRHVVEDVPAEVEVVRKEHPDIEIIVADYLGSDDEIKNIILKQSTNI